MSRMIGGLIFVYVMLTIFGGFISGSGGMNSTILTASMTDVATSCTVQSTGGFLDADTITIGGEEMTYTSKDLTHFYGLTRPDATAHGTTTSNGAPMIVYNQQTSLISAALGFNVSSVSSNAGAMSIFIIPVRFFTTTLPNLVNGSNITQFFPSELAFIGYIWAGLTVGITLSIGISLIWMASGIAQKLV